MIHHCYYMTQRPAQPGAQPKKGLTDIQAFDSRTFIPSIGREAYALLTYDRVLTAEEVRDYELVPDQFERMYALSWYTITGCGGDLNEWKEGYEKLLREQGIGVIMEWNHFTGAQMNEHYGLTGDNRYPDGLNFLAFSLDGLEIGKLAMLKMCQGDRWFDDIVDNNERRECLARR